MLETFGFFPQRRTCFAFRRSKRSCDSSRPKSASWAASPAPEQMSPLFTVTGPNASQKRSVTLFSTPSEPPER